MTYRGLLWVLFAWLVPFAAVHAQGAPEVQIGPVTAFCKDAKGNAVLNYVGSTASGAVAGLEDGVPAITVDPGFAASANWPVNVFAYLHACGLLAGGHAPGGSAPSPERQLAADCYAGRMSKATGWLNESDFTVAMSRFTAPTAKPANPPGHLRMVHALTCRLRG